MPKKKRRKKNTNRNSGGEPPQSSTEPAQPQKLQQPQDGGRPAKSPASTIATIAFGVVLLIGTVGGVIWFLKYQRDSARFASSKNNLKQIGIGRDIRDGTTTTMLAGEVSAGFKPWGHPQNWRDPAKGLKFDDESFGGPSSRGTLVLLADGSVRILSKDTDQKVLEAIGTINGGEAIRAMDVGPQ